MGCKGSKAAETPKSEGATLLNKPDESMSSSLHFNTLLSLGILCRSKVDAAKTQAPSSETTPTKVAGDASLEKAKESPCEAPATQGLNPESSTEVVVDRATAQKTGKLLNELPGDAILAKAEEAVETQEAPKFNLDATVMKAEDMKMEALACQETSATEQPREGSNEEPTETPDEVRIAAETVLAEKTAEADATSKEEVTEPAVSVASADAALAGKQGGCFGYCSSAEAQTEILVQY